MNAWQRWRARQSDLDFQTKRADWLDGQLARLELELKEAKKALAAERSSKDKFVLRHSDMMAQRAGLTPAFVKDAAPPLPPEPDFTQEDEDRITFMAQANMEADKAQGLTAYPIEHYIDQLKAHPNWRDLVVN